jgi:sulfite dehydrogenase (quinone) subunit SoeA
MGISRRTLLKGSAAVAAGGLLASRLPGTGLLTFESRVASPAEHEPELVEDVVRTTCWIGKQDCGMIAHRVNGRAIKLEGNPSHPRNLGRLCPKGVAQITTLYDPKRLKTPLVRTNGKGVPGEWREATWDEALELVAERLSEALQNDDRLAAIVPGREKVSALYSSALTGATGIRFSYGRRGNDCGGANQDAVLATWGVRSQIAPDLRHCRYLICYWNLTQAGGPGLCQITYPKEVADARARGMKVVSIDPYARSVANQADEWVPIKPGTDMAFWLAVIHVLLNEGFIDQEYLRQHTNAPSLVQEDGTLLRDEENELVWDAAGEEAVPYDAGTEPALFGVFEVDGVRVRPALQTLLDHVQRYSPEWAAAIAGVPAEQIRNIARELGQNAMIGSTTVIDGVEVPYRPVAYGMHGTSTKFHSSVQTNRAILLAFMILGAVESAGGAHIWSKQVNDPTPIHAGWLAAVEREEPERLDLGGTKWFPMGSSGYLMFPNTVNDPAAYNLPYRPEDMAILVHFVNPLMTSRPREKVMEAWAKFGFVAVVTPYLTVTSDYAADVVLPCGTLDKWEGPLNVRTLYYSADSIRVPVMDPIGQSRGDIDIYIDLCEKMGALYGEGGYIDRINQALAISEEHALPLDEKPDTPAILEAWAQSKHGLNRTLGFAGVVSQPIPPDRVYLSAWDPPFNGVRGAFYVEVFEQLREEMRARDVPESLWSHYAAYPTWTEPAIEQTDPNYDLYLVDFKRIEHKQTRTPGSHVLLDELMPDNPLLLNPETARERGLEDGDDVIIESLDPVSGETRRIQSFLRTTEALRPDSAAITHHVSKPDQPSANALLPYGDGFWDMGGSWYSHVKVRVWKA